MFLVYQNKIIAKFLFFKFQNNVLANNHTVLKLHRLYIKNGFDVAHVEASVLAFLGGGPLLCFQLVSLSRTTT